MMDLETIVLSEINQTQKNIVRFHLCAVPSRGKFMEPESRIGLSQVEGRGGEKRDLLSNEYRVYVEDKKVLEMDSADGYITLYVNITSLNYTLT